MQQPLNIDTPYDRVLAALQATDFSVTSQRPGEARLEFANVVFTARWDAGWLSLATRTEPCRDGLPTVDRIRNALHLNALARGTHYGYAPGDEAMHAATGFALDDFDAGDSQPLGERIVRGRDALIVARGFERPRICDDPWQTTDSSESARPLGDRLRDAGWPAAAGDDTACRVDLELTAGHQQATVAADGAGRLRLRADLLECAGDPGLDCAYAASVHLLGCASGVRLVAAVVDLRERQFLPGLEVVLPAGVNGEWLGHGLAALSTACDLAAETVEVLSYDAKAAWRYLHLHQPAPDR